MKSADLRISISQKVLDVLHKTWNISFCGIIYPLKSLICSLMPNVYRFGAPKYEKYALGVPKYDIIYFQTTKQLTD